MIAVIFHRLGPYHWARLQAASRAMPVLAIELSAETAEYAWDKVEAEAGFKRVTLFPKSDSRQASPQELATRLIACLETHAVEVVAIPGWSDKGALTALQWSLQQRVPVICMSESTEWDEARSAWREAVKQRIVGLCSAALVGGSPHKNYMVKLGMPPERTFLGYDAVDNGYFGEKAEMLKAETLKAESRKQYGLPENYFLASARFIEKKNLPRLVEAYARYRVLVENAENLPGEVERQTLHGPRKAETLKHRNTEIPTSDLRPPVSGLWSLVLLGDGALRSSLESQLSTLNLHEHVQMPGFKQYPDLPAYYGLASAFIHASTTEQWGLVVNEAMASGLPVLVSNRCGCAADLVQEGVNGFTFDPYNVEQLAQLMVRISAFRFPLSAFGAASARIIANWGPERFAQGLKAAVDCALKIGPKRASLFDRLLLKVLLRR